MAKFVCALPECDNTFECPPSWGKKFCCREHSALSLSRRYKGQKPSPQCLEAVSRANIKRLKNPAVQDKMQAALKAKRQDEEWAEEYGKRVSEGLQRYYETHDGPNLGREMPQTPEQIAYRMGKLRKERKTYTCDWCGKTFKRLPCHAKSDHLFCDRYCHAKWRSENLVGENHHGWQGGHEQWRGPNWKKQAAKARKRDGYRCRHCGMTQKEHKVKYGRKLNVHHIVPFREFGDNWHTANHLDNLITLCSSCHMVAEHRLNERNAHTNTRSPQDEP